jgi:hypothetical protein
MEEKRKKLGFNEKMIIYIRISNSAGNDGVFFYIIMLSNIILLFRDIYIEIEAIRNSFWHYHLIDHSFFGH